jgi:hypothetical protein
MFKSVGWGNGLNVYNLFHKKKMVNAFLNLQFVTGGSRKAKSQQQQKK